MLEINAVSKTFPAPEGPPRLALDTLDLSVAEHEIVSLVGTSGCGKSTLLRILSGLDNASEGEVSIAGRPVTGPNPDIAMVFQEPRLMPWLTVRENVRLALLDLPPEEQDRLIDEALSQVGLAAAAKQLPKQLSGGMAQRVAIARAIARHPKILLLDEPFSALDSFTRDKLQDHLLSLWEKGRFTMVFVTHDLEEAVVLSDRIAVLRGQPGRLAEVIEVDLPRPRDRASPEVQSLKRHLAGTLNLS
ncbi:ABC transporter ATP-binding protein [Limibacillus sp. MBR-115]|jgi:sulfonate transport system ATP-binding protein|uniref:ABC transporter ATP-binding protein n=1 Tax=Limibacillus sp. MBR-115 TaxID=3156465 RepID=UPI003398DAB6